MFAPGIFRANDIRGVWNKDFDLSFTKELAEALLKVTKKQNIKKTHFLVGYDARLSSPLIANKLLEDLKKEGAFVSSIGLSPSPLSYFLLQHYKLTACIVITASHNPPEYNGFKIVFNKKYKIADPIQLLKKTALQDQIIVKKRKTHLKSAPKKAFAKNLTKPFKLLSEKKRKNITLKTFKPYLESLKKEFSFKKTIFVVDTGHGALGPLAEKAFQSLGLKAKILFKKPDGHFPSHHPDPTLEKNLKELKKELKKGIYAFGLAFDGDGDRLVLVSPEGQTILGDELGFLLLKSLKKKSALILADVKCSDWFFKEAKKESCRVQMIKSGHGLVRRELEKRKADLAIEFSGHIFFNDKASRGFDDALYASLRWIELYQKTGKKIQELLPKINTAKTGEIRIKRKEEQIQKDLNKIKAYLKAKGEVFKSLDGVRLSRKNSWCLFRGSKTQSVLSMRFEAENKKALQELKKEFEKVLNFKIL